MYKLLPKLRVEDSDDNCRLLAAKWPSSGGGADSVASPPLEFLGEAIFAADSFWGLEAAYGRLDGVVRTAVGYYGGSLKNPNYREISEGHTGHTEAVKVVYDKRRVSYGLLCRVFWESHDSTNKDYLRFGAGTHFRSAIFYRSEEERKWAQESKVRWQLKLNRRIVTKILLCGSSEFYLAESHHQKYYLQKNYLPLCESLGLRSTKQLAESHLACKLNGILADDGKDTDEGELRRLMVGCQLPSQAKTALENILRELKENRRGEWVTFSG
ncbi:unnamed protein product [Spirodela intermedia]|uniref:peptide-methionine (S)-S-oxide reductase n=2 Tax=Spirodela intermedia TaxID=51605 RepID=A0A7I8KXI9_SPIIN|nr:unnamed protein product [Spirodela intermedia]CAA6665307.1 unnamed protein product [Spirodela intermedia]CAA7402036.1 unnamed protein product [Spirodela intermedia]